MPIGLLQSGGATACRRRPHIPSRRDGGRASNVTGGPGVAWKVFRAIRCNLRSSCLCRQPMRRQRTLGDVDVNARIKQLRDLVVTLDRIDRKLDSVDADTHKAAATAAFSLTYEEMGLLR